MSNPGLKALLRQAEASDYEFVVGEMRQGAVAIGPRTTTSRSVTRLPSAAWSMRRAGPRQTKVRALLKDDIFRRPRSLVATGSPRQPADFPLEALQLFALPWAEASRSPTPLH